MSNITLSVNDEIIKKVRKIAISQDTTMTAMIRDFLQTVAKREDFEKTQKITLLENSFKVLGRDMGTQTWTREDLYDR